jgi:putative SbcD/Mre11-related phosphoesterase
MNHRFIDKAVFFPEQGILAIGDLHVGYEHSLIESGILLPEKQVSEIMGNLERIINRVRIEGFALRKIVFLGDIKHYFNYEWKERFNFDRILDFLRGFLGDKDIILIKGNHDKFDFSGKKMRNHYFSKGIMFFHGHMDFQQLHDPRVKAWVMGHLHPSVLLSDRQGVKREKYKCFLTGSFRGKDVFIVPSFFGAVEGTPVNDPEYPLDEGFSAIPARSLEDFSVHAISDGGEILRFGKVKSLM